MAIYQTGLLIRGLSYASSEQATLFVGGDLDASTIPGGLSPLSSSTQIVGRLVGASGFAVSSSIREPIGVGGEVTATLQDDTDGTLARLFAGDPAQSASTFWMVDGAASVSASATSLTLVGGTAPTASQIVYLGSEAIKIGSVSTSGNVHTCTGNTRARCGSHAKVWQVDPSAYPAGDDGSYQSLIAHSRMAYDDVIYEAALYQFKMDDANPGAVSSCEFVWLGHVAARPEWDGDKFQWRVRIAHVSKTLKEWTFPGAKGLETRYVVMITRYASLHGISGIFLAPDKIKIFLSAYEVERLFNVRVRPPGTAVPVSADVTSLSDLLNTYSGVSYDLHGEIGGHEWVWRVDRLNPPTVAGGQFCSLEGSYLASSPNASINDNPVSFIDAPGDGYIGSRDVGLNAGFGTLATQNLVRVDQGEAPPKLTIRPRLRMSFPEAALTILLSGGGGQVNHATYDRLIGLRGLQLDPAWVNIGSTPADPLTVDEGTTAWLELAALLNGKYDYAILPETSGAEWFNNELRLHTCLLGFVSSTGKVAARLWARKRPGSVTALNPVVGAGDAPADLAESQVPIRAMFLERGLNQATLQPRFRKPIQLPEAKPRDIKEAVTIRIWKQGGAFTEQELETGPLARLERAFFGVTRGRPPIWRVPLAIDAGIAFGDLCEWSEPSVPTPSGIGVTSLPVLVVGVDRDMESGKLYARVMHDVVNAVTNASAGRIAPTLRIRAVGTISSTRFSIVVESAKADIGFRIDTSHGGIWQTIASATGRVRIVNPLKHNPTGATEREGMAEASVTVNSVTYDSGARRSYMDVTIGASWVRGSLAATDIITPGARVLLQDYRSADTNPEGATLQGNANQDYNGGSGRDFLSYATPGRKPKHDSRRSLIGS